MELLGSLGKRAADSVIWSVVAFGGQNLASASNSGVLKVWDTEHRSCLMKFSCDGGPVRSVTALSETCLATGLEDGVIKIWDTSQGNKCTLKPAECCVAKLEGHKERI